MIAGIHHATLLTSDLAKSRAFYEGVLGLPLAQNRPQMSFDGVWYDLASNQQIHLMLLPDPEAGLRRAAHGGRDRHIALVVKELSGLKARLEAARISYTSSQSGRSAVFCRDPDQNALEFIEVV
jgi:glyoxylase I family protein